MPSYDADINIDVGTDLDINSLSKTATKLENEFNRMFDSAVGKKTSARFKQLEIQASRSLSRMRELVSEINNIQFNSEPSEEVKYFTDRIKELKEQYSETKKELQEKIKIGASSGEIEKLKSKLASIKTSANEASGGLENAFAKQVQDAVAKAMPFAEELRDVENNLVVTKEKMKDAGNGAKSFKDRFKGLVTVFSKVRAGLKSVSSRFKEFFKRTNKAGSSVKNFVKAALGIGSLLMLFNKLKSVISDGFKNLSDYSPEFKSAISDFKNSLTTLKNSMAAAFAPIASAILPILTSLIDKVNTAVEALGKLIATLMGKKTYTRAVKNVGTVENAVGNANNQAQELQKTLAGFDDVEILNSNKDSGSGSGSSSGSGSGSMFEEASLGNEFDKLAEMIKDAWKKADFTEIGTLIGTKLRDALDSIPWDGIKEKMNKVSKSIATLLNGFLETPGLFDDIGSTLAEALNTGLEFLNTFATNFHWDSLGRAIADGINAFFRTTDFELAADTFSNWAKGILESIYTTLENVDWRQIGRKIKEFLKEVDWSGIAEGIAEAFGAALGGVTALIAEVFADVPGAIKEYFAKKIKEAGWDKDKGLLENGKAILLGILNGILDALKGIGKWVKEHILQPFIDGFKKAFGIASPAKEMEDTGENILNGVLEGMLNIIKNIKKWVSDNILEPIKGAFKGFKATIEVGLEKAKNWASDVWEGIKSGAETIKKTIKHGMENGSGWKDKIFNFLKDPGVITKTLKHGMKSLSTWKDKVFDFFTGKNSVIEKTLSLDVAAKNTGAKTALNKLGVFTASTIETLLQVKVEAAVENMRDNRKDKSLDTTAKYNNVDKTALTGTNKPWINTDAHYNNAINKLGSKPWFYADSYYNTAKNNLSGKPWYYADSYYNTANNNLYGKPWYYADSYYNTAKNNLYGKPWYYADSYYNSAYNNLGYKPWYYADSYYNNAYNSLSWKPWFYADAYMNQAYDYIPWQQKVINVSARIQSAVLAAFREAGGVYTTYGGWSDIPQYAGGTTNAQGSMFIAGEAGPEIVGHINGRTEVLNKSQIASAIYAAVKTAMLVGMNQLRSIIPVPMPINLDIESLAIPDIVKGCIVPYETRLAVMENVIANQNQDPVTGEELRGLISDVISAVNKVQFYIGDEQIARHSQLGNQKLDRRYNPVVQGA